MSRSFARTLLLACGVPLLLLQAGCLSWADVGAIATGQLISFVNALVNTATSDAIRAALGA